MSYKSKSYRKKRTFLHLKRYFQGSTSPLTQSPEASKTGAGLVNFARSVVRGLVEIF